MNDLRWHTWSHRSIRHVITWSHPPTRRQLVTTLDDERHVLLVRQPGGLLAHPEAVVDGEGVDRHREVLRVDLGELLAARVVFEEGVEHLVGDLLGAGPVDLVHLLGVGVVGVETPEGEDRGEIIF